MKAQKPIPQPKVKVDLSQAETVKCEECDNYSFIQSFYQTAVGINIAYR